MLKYNRLCDLNKLINILKNYVLISNTSNTDEYNPYKPKICEGLNNY